MKMVIIASLMAVIAMLCTNPLAAQTQPVEPDYPDITWTPTADLRVRQEYMDGVLYFRPDPDVNQYRFRTRAGVTVDSDQHSVKFLLANEHRRYVHPDGVEFDWDELIIDQLYWRWHSDTATLTTGRQNIIWDDGFLMLEGKPYDGSRSIFQNAVRFQRKTDDGGWDVSVIYNRKYDPLVIAGDADRMLRDANELATAAKFQSKLGALEFILKHESDPDEIVTDLLTTTFAYRATAGSKEHLWWTGEVAGQYQDWEMDENHTDFALQTRAELQLSQSARGHLGYFHYGENFRTPWGRWPLWSDLYIYTLIGESTPQRVHVAAWENIAAPFIGAQYQFSSAIKGKVRAYHMMAPDSNWDVRGELVQAKLDWKLNQHVKGHLLWEMLDPGKFHENQPGMTDTVHFLRWEIILSI